MSALLKQQQEKNMRINVVKMKEQKSMKRMNDLMRVQDALQTNKDIKSTLSYRKDELKRKQDDDLE